MKELDEKLDELYKLRKQLEAVQQEVDTLETIEFQKKEEYKNAEQYVDKFIKIHKDGLLDFSEDCLMYVHQIDTDGLNIYLVGPMMTVSSDNGEIFFIRAENSSYTIDSNTKIEELSSEEFKVLFNNYINKWYERRFKELS